MIERLKKYCSHAVVGLKNQGSGLFGLGVDDRQHKASEPKILTMRGHRISLSALAR
jgi:hypothetical protein